jgi:hypothetical protein
MTPRFGKKPGIEPPINKSSSKAKPDPLWQIELKSSPGLVQGDSAKIGKGFLLQSCFNHPR